MSAKRYKLSFASRILFEGRCLPLAKAISTLQTIACCEIDKDDVDLEEDATLPGFEEHINQALNELACQWDVESMSLMLTRKGVALRKESRLLKNGGRIQISIVVSDKKCLSATIGMVGEPQ